jgi:hypothetical protein
VIALQGVPEDVDIEAASREWAKSNLGESSEDYYLAFKIDGKRFKVVTRIDGIAEERVAPAGRDGEPLQRTGPSGIVSLVRKLLRRGPGR